MILERTDRIVVNSLGKEFHFAERGIRDDPVDDPVQIGLSLEVLRIGFNHNLLIRDPLHKTERACSDGLSVKRGGIDILLFEKMFRDDSHAPGPETRRERLTVSDLESVRIEDLCLFHQFIVAPANRVRLLIHDLVVSKLHIFGRKLLSVMPEDSLSQKEGDLRFRPCLDLPGLCQIADKVLKISVVFDQTVENEDR